jgi:two-component system, cell cycle sensor histidine kinase and response regulator CckA
MYSFFGVIMPHWFQKKNFTDEKDRQIAHILSLLIAASWVAYLVVFFCGLYYHDRKVLAVTILGSILQFVPFWLLRRGHLLSGSWVLSVSVLGTLTSLATFGQGYHDISIFAFPIILVFTSMTLNRSAFIINTVLLLASIGWLVFGQMNAWFRPAPIPPSSYWVDFMLLTVILSISAFAIDLLVIHMRKNLERAQREIEQRKKAEEALRKSEAKFRAVIENSNDGILFCDADARITYRSPSCAHNGFTDEARIGHIGFELVHPDDRAEMRRFWAGRLEHPEAPAKTKFRLLNKDGTWRWIEMTGQNLLHHPDVASMVLTSRDITEGMLAEEALRDNEERYRQLFNSSPDGIILIGPDACIASANIAMARMYRYDSPDDLIGLYTPLLVAPTSQKYSEQIIRRRLKGEDIPPVEYELVRKDGTTFFGETSATILHNADGTVSGYICTTRDTTERKKSEQALRESEERYRMMFEGTSLAINITRGTDIIYANPSYLKIFGYASFDELKQVAPLELFSPECRQKVAENIQRRAIGLPVPDSYEAESLRKDGTRFPMLMYLTKATFADGPATVGFILDITERKRMEEELQKVEKLESLGILAGGIAHDFNNLLGGLFGYIDMARVNSGADKTVSKYLDKASAVFERAKDLTQQLLTFSKGGSPKRKTGHVGSLVKENAAFALSGSNIGCDYNIARDLWPCDFDENQIGQVIDNIVINAQQAMPLGGTISISVDNISLNDGDKPALSAGDYIKISIADSGVGIPQELLKRIFDPFFTTKQKGNGLGLATCYSIIQKHEGCIDVESAPGKGSVFHIFLPASHGGAVQDISQSPSCHEGKGRILVMDDEDFMREIVGEMLTSMGYSIIEARNGEEALRFSVDAEKQGNLISGALFDLTIPGGVGGREAIVEFRKEFPDMPVFASSGFSDDPVMARPAEFGFTDSIRKPFKKGDLAEMLNKHLKLSEP